MKKTGKLLQDKRESAGLTLSEVALATKINPKILTAIEGGDEAHLPARTILKGFVRSYALFLKMDVDEILAVHLEETGGPAPGATSPTVNVNETPAANAAPAMRRRMNDENSSGMRTAAVVVIVLLIGLIIGVRELIEKYQREKVTVASEPAAISESNVNAPVAEATTNNNATPTPPPAAATTPPPVVAAPAEPPKPVEAAKTERRLPQ